MKLRTRDIIMMTIKEHLQRQTTTVENISEPRLVAFQHPALRIK